MCRPEAVGSVGNLKSSRFLSGLTQPMQPLSHKYELGYRSVCCGRLLARQQGIDFRLGRPRSDGSGTYTAL